MSFESLDDVIDRANHTAYGLGASISSADIARAEALAARLEAGTVWINESQTLSPHPPFGGHKHSGIGVEGGVEGLLEFCQAQTAFVRRGAPHA